MTVQNDLECKILLDNNVHRDLRHDNFTQHIQYTSIIKLQKIVDCLQKPKKKKRFKADLIRAGNSNLIKILKQTEAKTSRQNCGRKSEHSFKYDDLG